MHIVSMNQWGNSLGLRVPASLVKSLHAQIGEKYSVDVTKKGDLIFSPIKDPQAGWTEAFNAYADAVKSTTEPTKEHDLLNLPNKFDDEEWTW